MAVTVTASPSAVVSGGTSALTATAVDSQGHTSFAWSWSDGGAGGTFSSSTAQSPSYKAPANTFGSARSITLTVTATCSASTTPVTGTKSAALTVSSTTTTAHVALTSATATPSTVASGGTVALSMTAKDLYGHTGFSYQWSDNGAGGTFSSTTAQNPSYKPRANTSGAPRTVALTASAICKWQYPWATGSAPVSLTVNSQ